MSESTVQLVRDVAQRWPQLAELYRANVDDMGGEVLPHLVLSEYVDWMERHVEGSLQLCAEVWAWLGHCYDTMDEDVANLVRVSGVEMLPDPSTPAGRLLRSVLPASLRPLDPWPSTD